MRGLPRFDMAVAGALVATVLLATGGSAMAAAGVKELSSDTPAPVVQGHALLKGHYASNAVLSVNVGLEVRQRSELNELIEAASIPGSPEYGHYLTNAQYLTTYAPTSSEVSAVTTWLRGQGLHVTGASPDNLLVYVRASTVAAEHAFGVTINTYTFAGREFHSSDRNPAVPADLSIEAVSGLSNYAVAQAATTCSGSVCGYNGSDFRTAYNVSGDGKGQTIGFTLWGTGLPQSDYTEYARATGTTSLKVGASGEDGLEFIPVGGASTKAGTREIALDTQIAHAVAPGVHETYWLGHDNSPTTLEQVLNEAANSSISIISNSWEFSGTDACHVLDLNMENALQHGAATGKTFYFAAGDYGATAGCRYPAVSQYDVAVGGTQLEVGAGSIWSSEKAFNNSGGCSNSVPRPSWQTGIGEPLEWPSNACTGRAVPDVSADSCASKEGGSGSGCGAYVYFQGPGVSGGTSLAAPIWAALSVIWNKLNAAVGRPGIGFSAPLLYSLANNPSTYSRDFHDITTGSNGFPATAGWDEATGWGSPNFNNLVNLPIAQQGPKLTGSGETGSGHLGRAVTISADGSTALVGGGTDNSSVGAVWVYTRTGSTWTQQAELTGSSEVGAGLFGESVALSADGNAALVGAPNDNANVGAAWVFTRSGSTWTQQGSKLTGTGETGKGKFGSSAALSADGNTAVIGGETDHSSNGAAWAFTRSGTTWTQQGEKFTGQGEVGKAKFGQSLSLSTDGNTALIGGTADNINVGAAWAFTRSGTTWSQPGAKLTGSGEVGEGRFGSGVALSSDGNTALIGAHADNGSVGAAWAFTRSGSTWTQEGEKLTGSGEVGTGHFGQSVALSSNGDRALIGGSGDNGSIGAVWLLTREGSTWTQLGEKLTGSGETGAGVFGQAVALCPDGNAALVGGPNDSSGVGAAWVFVSAPSVTGVSPSSGPSAGGTSVTITGTNLTDAAAVKFGATNAASFIVNSPTSITAVSPAGSGTVDLTVTTSGGTSATGLADQFSYEAESKPTITKVKPPKGRVAGGTTVMIAGTNLTGASAVKFGSLNASSFSVSSDTTIRAVSPAENAGTVDITVTTSQGTSALSSVDRFKYFPTVSNVSPPEGSTAGGTSVAIAGTGFVSGATRIKFGSTKATSVSCTTWDTTKPAVETTCTATSPSHAAGKVDVKATVAGQSSPKVAADQFTYN